MSDTWYYAELDKPVGPISIVELKRFLDRLKDWKDRLVWHSSFSDYALTHVDFRPAQPANRGRPNERQRGFWRREAAGLVPVHLQARTACLDRWCMIYEGQ